MEEDQTEVTGRKHKKGRLAVKKISHETNETKRPLTAVYLQRIKRNTYRYCLTQLTWSSRVAT